MDQRIINLYDSSLTAASPAANSLTGLTELAGSAAAAAALLPLLQNNYAQAAIVAEQMTRASLPSGSPTIHPRARSTATSCAPKAKGKRPGRHRHPREPGAQSAYRGRRPASRGGGLPGASPPTSCRVNGGTPPNEDAARELHHKTNREDMIAAAVAAVPFMQKHAESTGKVGAVGFCFGGGVVNRMADRQPRSRGGVPYYGAQAPADKVPAIKAALLLHYAEIDENINKGIAAYEAALKANNKKYTMHIYPGTQHAFNNELGAARYNKEAADLAWGRTSRSSRSSSARHRTRPDRQRPETSKGALSAPFFLPRRSRQAELSRSDR